MGQGQLQAKSDEVECQRAEFQTKSDELYNTTDELQAKSDVFECQLAGLSDELQSKSEEFTRQRADLQTKYNELQAMSEAKSNADTANAKVVYGFVTNTQTELSELGKIVIKLKEQMALANPKH